MRLSRIAGELQRIVFSVHINAILLKELLHVLVIFKIILHFFLHHIHKCCITEQKPPCDN